MKFQFILKRFSIQQDSIAMLTLYGASELDDEYFSFNSDDFAEMENKHRCPAASSIEIFREQECVNIVHDERGFFSRYSKALQKTDIVFNQSRTFQRNKGVRLENGI